MTRSLSRFGLATADARPDVLLTLVNKSECESVLADAPEAVRALARLNGFKGEAGRLLIAAPEGDAPAVGLVGVGAGDDPFALAAASEKAPDGVYALAGGDDLDAETAGRAAFAWGLGRYRFSRYKDGPDARPQFIVPKAADGEAVGRALSATYLARDLVNTPAEDMGPDALETEARRVAEACDAKISVIAGDELLKENYPLIHTVGRAAEKAPRLITVDWGKEGDPRLVLIGKGVCFDSGGLNLKPGEGMSLMKKDMGGSANALALAQMVMEAKLPVRLTLLIPAVENAVSGSSFRPGDVLQSRAGKTVEIGNTDAEGRLVLADALARAGELNPVLTVTLATLTGAARVALGPEVPPFYTDDDALAASITASAEAVADPVWRMPLWNGYDSWIDSEIADVSNMGTPGPFAGSITAALFLKRFAPTEGSWAHFDIYAWSLKKRPGRPVGGEAQAIRALFDCLSERWAPGK